MIDFYIDEKITPVLMWLSPLSQYYTWLKELKYMTFSSCRGWPSTYLNVKGFSQLLVMIVWNCRMSPQSVLLCVKQMAWTLEIELWLLFTVRWISLMHRQSSNSLQNQVNMISLVRLTTSMIKYLFRPCQKVYKFKFV